MKSYQLVVIGAGSGGLVAAEIAAKLGARVALVEAKPNLGGECLNSGCVPSKALIHAARLAASLRQGERFGVKAKVEVDFASVMAHVRRSIQQIEDRSDNDARYQSLGVDMYHGPVRFTGRTKITSGDVTIRAKRFIIATGSSPLVPQIEGLDDAKYLTNENIFELKKLPKRLAVIGGGPIGCELGQAMSMLGSQVSIINNADRLLPREEPESSAALAASFQAQAIQVISNAKVEMVQAGSGGLAVRYRVGDQMQQLLVDQVLVATGRQAHTDLDLDRAGVTVGKRGIEVNGRLETSAKHIYAIGDCTGGPQFTHIAAEHAGVAVQNALFGRRATADLKVIPWVTFTTPEIAHLGQTEAEVAKANTPHRAYRLDYHEIDKAVTEGEAGFIKVVAGQDNRILGASVVGAGAGELLAQINLAFYNGLKVADFAKTIQAYPTYSLGLKEMAGRDRLERLVSGWKGKLVKAYLRSRLGS
ncbi:MAG TPA: FAD-dependent oxidoreductase [Candidatus Saccharimonadales bacterium]|nr:FAD-dependent oxidoreductase [Candidatus Saccharimonadales bacterium]